MLLAAVGIQRSAPVEDFLLDPASVAGVAWYTGMLSNVGILAWTVAATAAGGGAWLSARLGRSTAAVFLGTGSALTSLLLVDDLLQLHAVLLPSLGLTKTTAQLLIVAPAPLWAWVNRREILRTRWMLFGAAIAGFALSLLADQWLVAPDPTVMDVMIEDGAKLLGVVAWAQYFVLTTVDIARSATDETLARADGAPRLRAPDGGGPGHPGGATASVVHNGTVMALAIAQLDLAEDDIIDGVVEGSEWLRAGLIVVGSVVAAVIAVRLVRWLMRRSVGEGFAALITSRLVGYTIFLVGVIYALTSLGVRLGPLLGALGIGGLVLALALQKPVENFFDGIILQTRRPFTVGDTVVLGDHTGVVEDIDSRTTLLRSLDGVPIRVPNATVAGLEIINLTREPVRRSTLDVGVAYDTDLDVATAALGIAVQRVDRILGEPAPLVLLSDFGASSIDFTIYFWHRSDVPSELATRHDLLLAVHQTLANDGITIAFPQMVVWSGEPRTGPVYETYGGPIRTAHPHLDESEPTQPRGRTRSWFWSRSSTERRGAALTASSPA